MAYLQRTTHGSGITEVRLERGKVNALNEPLVDELSASFRELASDDDVRGVILTGAGKFFSFGFDIPEFLDVPPEAFTRFVRKFTALYRDLFAHPKPVVAAINGHAVAGGCMLTTACDARVMVDQGAKIGLNEIGFGSTVFAGSAALLRYWVGERRAQEAIYGGTLYTAEQALALGLLEAVVPQLALRDRALLVAKEYAAKPSAAFRSIKALARAPVLEEIDRREPDSIREFVDLWYSKETRLNLEKIKIHS